MKTCFLLAGVVLFVSLGHNRLVASDECDSVDIYTLSVLFMSLGFDVPRNEQTLVDRGQRAFDAHRFEEAFVLFSVLMQQQTPHKLWGYETHLIASSVLTGRLKEAGTVVLDLIEKLQNESLHSPRVNVDLIWIRYFGLRKQVFSALESQNTLMAEVVTMALGVLDRMLQFYGKDRNDLQAWKKHLLADKKK